ncbi:hypothetical protein ACQ33O_06530 [Ferruginibacter sp. SUN002]|uniref:hypothetical protein n=1 Tax=Ferruginibacter sp. SUN002 TaxID=2937789 RepID=UPI003D35B098
MKKVIKTLTLLVLINNCTYCQIKNTITDSFTIDTIKDYRIKLDGSCSFYSYDSIPENQLERIFVISSKKVAFFALKDQHDYIYLKQMQVKILKNGDRQKIFSGHGFKAILVTRKTEKSNNCRLNCTRGELKIARKKYKIKIPVRGIEDN